MKANVPTYCICLVTPTLDAISPLQDTFTFRYDIINVRHFVFFICVLDYITNTWRCQDYCSGVYCQSFGLVQLASVWCAREPADEGAVSTERCCSSTHQRTQMWPHHSTAASVTLAVSPETSGVQDCVSCTPVASFSCTNLPDYWHSSRLRVWSSPSALVYW